MTGSITPLIMLAIFLLGTLWLGMRYKKGSRSIMEYTIGNRMFTTAALIATIVATAHGGGGLIRTVEMIYTKGLWYIVLMIGMTITDSLSWIMVTNRIGLFMEGYIASTSHISMADTLGQVYGRIPRVMTALATVGESVASIALQVTVTSRALQICISDVNPAFLMVISASIVILYSTFGGIRAVTITDILQCATFTIMIPYVAYKVFHHTGMSIPQIFRAVVQSEKFQLKLTLQDKMQLLSLVAASIGFGAYPESVQRMYMARNSQQAREACAVSIILRTSILIVILFLGITVSVGYDCIADQSMVWPTIISDTSAVFKGFFVISLFAMAMSTADSCLNVASSMVAYDVVNPLRKHKLTDKQQLYLAKATCFIMGILAILLALYITKHSKTPLLRLMYLAIDISSPIFVAPFFLAVFGFRCKERTAVWGMVVGVITITLWMKFIPDIDGSFVAMLANGLTMILAHYSLSEKDRQSWQKSSLDYQQLQ